MTEHPERPGMRNFLVIWLGQLVSLVGTGLTSFAIGVWVYQQTGSVTQFGLLTLFTVLPGILAAPLAGAIIDRSSRRNVLIVSDLVAGVSTLALALLITSAWFTIWLIYAIIAIRSICDAFRWPALVASISLLVPKADLGRANGMLQGARAASQIAPPALAGVLIVMIGLEGVIAIDFTTFLIAITTLLLSKIPNPETTEDRAARRPLRDDLAVGWRYIKTRSGLVGLLTVFGVVNFLSGIITVLVTPLVLATASTVALGSVLTIGGLGMLVGSVLMAIWGGPKRRINGVLGFMLLDGLCIAVVGLRPSIPLYAAAAFGFFFGLAISNSSFWTIWQSRVPAEIQGRVFSVIQMIALASLPIGYVVAGPLAEFVFEPLLATNGALAGSVGQIIGVGPGRGIGLLFIVLGILIMTLATWGYLNQQIRLVEDQAPDVTPATIAPEAVDGDRTAPVI